MQCDSSTKAKHKQEDHSLSSTIDTQHPPAGSARKKEKEGTSKASKLSNIDPPKKRGENKQNQLAKRATPLTTLLKALLFICIQFTCFTSTKIQILTPEERMDKAGGKEEEARRPHVGGGGHALQDEQGGA